MPSHHAKDKDNMLTADANKTGLGITFWWKQEHVKNETDSVRKQIYERYQTNSIGELELLAVVWGLDKFRFHLYGKKKNFCIAITKH